MSKGIFYFFGAFSVLRSQNEEQVSMIYIKINNKLNQSFLYLRGKRSVELLQNHNVKNGFPLKPGRNLHKEYYLV